MYDVITFGSATWDMFLKLKDDNYQIWDESTFDTKKALCVPFGSKIYIEELYARSGGGGTNSAATFKKQGFDVAYVGKIGSDKRGEAVLDDLGRFGVEDKFVRKDKDYPTAYSTILSCFEEDRTVLVYRGACHFMKEEEIPLDELEAKWMYLAPLSEETSLLFPILVQFAKEKGMKVVANPGNSQLKMEINKLEPVLKELDVLILNLEEAHLLTGIDITEERKILKKLTVLTDAYIVMTKGGGGSMVVNGDDLYIAGVNSVTPVEKTGAGDAYSSGFVTGLLRKKSIEYSMQLGTANAVSCISKVGAKEGLLDKGEWGDWPRVEIKKEKL